MYNSAKLNQTREENYQKILKNLNKRGLITEPTRYYSEEPNAVGLMIEDRVVDFPSSYEYLRALYMNMYMEDKYVGDFPKDITKYGGIIPVAFMVGDTVEVTQEWNYKGQEELSPKQKVFQLVTENTSPTPKYQDIMYILGEKRGEEIIPRRIGRINAFMLEFAYGSAVGNILIDTDRYVVPQSDLTEEERKSAINSQSDWGRQHKYFLKDHPKIQINSKE